MEIWQSPEGGNLKESFQLKKLKHTKYGLSREHKNLLRKRGHKYYQLMDGTILPQSAEQQHFVDVCNGLVEPNDEWERIWKSYLTTLAEEQRLETLYRDDLRQSPDVQKYIDHRWLAGVPHSEPSSVMEPAPSTDGHLRDCRICRGSGMNADGSACDRCNGRGSFA